MEATHSIKHCRSTGGQPASASMTSRAPGRACISNTTSNSIELAALWTKTTQRQHARGLRAFVENRGGTLEQVEMIRAAAREMRAAKAKAAGFSSTHEMIKAREIDAHDEWLANRAREEAAAVRDAADREWLNDQLKARGFKVERDEGGSTYYVRETLRVRVSSHTVPASPERSYNNERGGFTWANGGGVQWIEGEGRGAAKALIAMCEES